MSSYAVGIDLGTTHSAIAIVNKHGVPEVLPNAEGDRITPSAILFDEDDIIIGNYAKQAAVAFPEQVVEFVKRHMGRSDWSFDYRGQRYTPERLSSLVLAKLKHDAELRLGHAVHQAVITVPAYFGHRERQATIKAGEMAGLDVLRLINEPTAAATAYGLNNIGRDMRCLVFDLGGGTFDVTIIDLEGKDILVRATSGDNKLGGKDWDDCLIAYAAEAFQEKHGVDPRQDLAAHHDLRQKCVSAKLALTKRPEVTLFYDYQGHILRQKIPRTLFEGLTAHLLERCRKLTEEVLREAKTSAAEVDTVLLAGGSTRMPMVGRLIREMFNKEPARDINPDECVAMGAALTAALDSASLAGEEPPIDIRTHDVAGHSLGMVVYKEGRLHNTSIIRRNSRIPCEHTRDYFVTTHDGQTVMDLWLIQGENPDPMECNVLGHFEFYGIPPRQAGQSRLAVTYRYNANGIVEVEAMDLNTGQTLAHRVAASSVTLEDVARNRVPVHVALLMDSSGSMYGANIQHARTAAVRFAKNTMRPNRSVALYTFPGGQKTRPTRNVDDISQALSRIIPIGSSPLHEGLQLARKSLKGKAGMQRVFVILTDGHPDDPEAAMSECVRIRRSGGRIITIGVGENIDQEFLQRMCMRPSDYHPHSENVELDGTF
ncbi:MAG: Hsp70 family protein, partial [Myxococcota bacterium]